MGGGVGIRSWVVMLKRADDEVMIRGGGNVCLGFKLENVFNSNDMILLLQT